MSTLPVQAPSIPQIWPVAGFRRVVSTLVTFLEVFREAQEQAQAAHDRSPFADW